MPDSMVRREKLSQLGKHMKNVTKRFGGCSGLYTAPGYVVENPSESQVISHSAS